jgi:hypothetical protein
VWLRPMAVSANQRLRGARVYRRGVKSPDRQRVEILPFDTHQSSLLPTQFTCDLVLDVQSCDAIERDDLVVGDVMNG